MNEGTKNRETNLERWFCDAWVLCGIEVRKISVQGKQYKQVIYEDDLIAQIPIDSFGTWLEEKAICSVAHPDIRT